MINSATAGLLSQIGICPAPGFALLGGDFDVLHQSVLLDMLHVAGDAVLIYLGKAAVVLDEVVTLGDLILSDEMLGRKVCPDNRQPVEWL